MLAIDNPAQFAVGAGIGAVYVLATAGSTLFRSLALTTAAAALAWMLATLGIDVTVGYLSGIWREVNARPNFVSGIAAGAVGAIALAVLLRRQR